MNVVINCISSTHVENDHHTFTLFYHQTKGIQDTQGPQAALRHPSLYSEQPLLKAHSTFTNLQHLPQASKVFISSPQPLHLHPHPHPHHQTPQPPLKMKFLPLTLTLTTLLATTTALSMPNPFLDPFTRRGAKTACGRTNGPCNQNGCAGRNNPNGGTGVCTAGQFKGCSCNSVCSGLGDCAQNGCRGNEDGTSPGGGRCTAGQYNNCFCNIDVAYNAPPASYPGGPGPYPCYP